MISAKERQYLFFFIVLITACLFSCLKPPCECDFAPRQYIECRLVNRQGQNLVFGPNAIYKFDSIQILKNDHDLSINNASVDRLYRDSSFLRFDFYVPESRSFIYFNQQTKTDTLDIEWIKKTGKCCGAPSTYYITGEVKFNNVLIQPTNGIYYFLK